MTEADEHPDRTVLDAVGAAFDRPSAERASFLAEALGGHPDRLAFATRMLDAAMRAESGDDPCPLHQPRLP